MLTFPHRTVVLVDGSHLNYRSWNVFKEFRTSTGIPTGIQFGLVRAFEYIKKQYPGCLIIFVKDGPNGAAARQRVLPTYKDNRGGGDPNVYNQKTLVYTERLVLALGGVIAYDFDSECDDLIACLCHETKRFPNRRLTVIYSGDDDFCQLCVESPNDTVLWKPGQVKGTKDPVIINGGDVMCEWGVEPEDLALYRTFTGDSSDVIKGIPRIPRRNLQAAVANRRTVENFYKSDILAHFTPEWKQRILEFHEQAIVNFRVTKLPWTFIDTPLEYTGVGSSDLQSLCQELEFRSILKKFNSFVSLMEQTDE